MNFNFNSNYDYCLSSTTYIECIHSLFLMIILLILFLFLSYGLIRTYRSYFQKGFKFEQFILLNGLLVIIVQVFLIFFKTIFLVHFIHFLNLFIVVYITKRFIRAFCQVKHIDIDYERFFLVFNIVNCLFLVVNIGFTIVDCYFTYEKLYYIVLSIIYLHKIFAFVITYIYYKTGLSVIKFLQESIFSEIIEGKEEKEKKEEKENDEVYTKLRIKQIRIIIQSNFYSYILIILIFISANIYQVIEDHESGLIFYGHGSSFFSTNDDVVNWLVFFYCLCLLIPVIGNYFAFYFLLRHSVSSNIAIKKVISGEERKDLTVNLNIMTSHEIDLTKRNSQKNERFDFVHRGSKERHVNEHMNAEYLNDED